MANPEASNETWQALFDKGRIGIIDPESMVYVPLSDTEGQLMIAGAVSGNVVTFKVPILGPLSRGATALKMP
jgi:hypothetical protein